MKNIILLIITIIASCKLPESDRNYDALAENKVYKLQLNPAYGTTYHYDIINETNLELEVNGKEVENMNRTTSGVNYAISKDSSGNTLINITYDKINVYTKNGDKETMLDAGNTFITADPVERMLGLLTKANITATVNQAGEITSVSGYKELGEKIMSSTQFTDEYTAAMAKEQLTKLIANGIVKKNLDQFFRIFPDSAIHLNDTWKIDSRQEGDIPMNVKSTFILKTINNDIASLESKGTLTSDASSSFLTGFNAVSTNLKGTQDGEFEVEMKTGMLINATIKATIDGTVQAMAQDIPIEIKTSVQIKGKKK